MQDGAPPPPPAPQPAPQPHHRPPPPPLTTPRGLRHHVGRPPYGPPTAPDTQIGCSAAAATAAAPNTRHQNTTRGTGTTNCHDRYTTATSARDIRQQERASTTLATSGGAGTPHEITHLPTPATPAPTGDLPPRPTHQDPPAPTATQSPPRGRAAGSDEPAQQPTPIRTMALSPDSTASGDNRAQHSGYHGNRPQPETVVSVAQRR